MSCGSSPPFDLDQILYMGIRSNPVKITIWCAMGAVAVALLLGKILVDVARYYDYFGAIDKLWVRISVALGAIASVGLLVISCVKTCILVQHAFTDFHTVFTLDNTLGYASDFIGAFLNIGASSYYTWRTYKLSGKKIWLGGCLMVLNVATFALGLMVTIKGMTAPAASMETAMELKAFHENIMPWYKFWGGFSMTSDGLVCGCMIFFLFKSRTSVFHQGGKRVYHKLNALFIETMMPPVIGIFIMDVQSNLAASPTGDWRRVVRAMIPPLFFVSLIHSLVARAVIQRMLNSQLASDGIHQMSNNRSHGNVFVASMPTIGNTSTVDDTKRDMEASTDHIIPLDKVPSFHQSDAIVNGSPLEYGKRSSAV